MLFVCVSLCDHLCLLGEIILAISLIFSVERICILKLADSVYIHIRVCVCVCVCVYTYIFSSVQYSYSVLSESLRPHGWQHARFLDSSPTPGDCSNSCPSSQYCHPNIMSSVVPFSSCLQFFPASGSLPTSQLFELGGQSIRVSAST